MSRSRSNRVRAKSYSRFFNPGKSPSGFGYLQKHLPDWAQRITGVWWDSSTKGTYIRDKHGDLRMKNR